MRFLALFLLIPSLAHAADFADVSALKSRLDAHDSELLELRHKIDALQLAIKCPCGRGGKCICPPNSCLCPNCPEHHGKTATATGVKLLGFKSASCVHCPGAEADCAGLAVEWIDADTDPRAKAYNVGSVPALVRIEGGKKTGHFEGRTGLADAARKWLGMEAITQAAKPTTSDSLRTHLTEEHGYSQSQVAGMSDAQVKAAHDRAHNSPAKRVIRTAKPGTPLTTISGGVRIPLYSPTPTFRPTYSAPPQAVGRSVTRYGGPTWTWPGNLRQHLESVHGVSTAGLSDSQLRTVHDNLHNARQSGITGGYSQPRVSYARPSYQPRVMFSSGCPGGMCPR